MTESSTKITGGRVLARNTVLNLLGSGAPMLVAFVAIPLLIQRLGTERFGILTVSWVLIGYFSLFDLGLGRAVTKLLAEKLGAGHREDIPALVWTALFLMLVLGVFGALLLAALSPWMVRSVLEIPASLQNEARRSFYLLALSLPLVIGTAGLRGVLEANQNFGAVNAIRIPLGLFTYLGPLAVLPFSTSLVAIVTVLLLGRVLAWVAHLVICLRIFPSLREEVVLCPEAAGALARFGGWMTVSNVVSPLMTQVDRFLIGALISMTAVAYYATPYEVVTKLWVIPNALMGVLFPAFAATFVSDKRHTRKLFDQSVWLIFLATFPIILVVVTLAREGLYLWLGTEFARNSTRVLQWLALGVLINGMAQVPFAMIQGVGRPDLISKLHLVELPLYAAGIWWLGRTFGLEGVAIAWALRIWVDAIILFAITERFLPTGASLLRSAALVTVPALLALAIAAVPEALTTKIALLSGLLIGLGLFAWHHLAPSGRALLRSREAL